MRLGVIHDYHEFEIVEKRKDVNMVMIQLGFVADQYVDIDCVMVVVML